MHGVKTGRLLRFERPGGKVYAYFFREGDCCHAAIYVSAGQDPAERPDEELTGPDEAGLEGRVRAWVDERFPRDR